MIISFAVQELFSLMQYHLIFAFIAHAFGVISKKSLPRTVLRSTGSNKITLKEFPLLNFFEDFVKY
jgi:hypothetical protein